GADPKLVAALADQLLTAENPVLVTGYAGRNEHASKAIDALSQFAGIAVYEANMTNNISHDAPCFIGLAADKAVPVADVGTPSAAAVPGFPPVAPTPAESYTDQLDTATV